MPIPLKKCAKCQGGCACTSRHPTNPARDIMTCQDCGRETYRYEDTKYERSHPGPDRKINKPPACPNCKNDEDLVPLPSGVYPAERRFRCKMCETRFTVYADNTIKAE